MMKRIWTAGLLLVASAQVASAQADIADIRKGVADGLTAGRETSVLFPASVGIGSATALALADDGPINNNQVVSALVLNTAISAGVAALTSILLPPRPSDSHRRQLEQQSALYVNSWRRGFRETAGKRRFNATALGVLAGAAATATIYSLKSK